VRTRASREKGLEAKIEWRRSAASVTSTPQFTARLGFSDSDLTEFDALIDHMDAWVEKMRHPATKADVAELGCRIRMAKTKTRPSLSLGCLPAGCLLYLAMLDPAGGVAKPLLLHLTELIWNCRMARIFVDLNGNGVRDKRETLSQAWQRLGLLKPGHKLTQAAYASCVNAAAAKLVKEGLLPKKVGEFYAEQANKARLPELSPNN
jgi:hypothetical protein